MTEEGPQDQGGSYEIRSVGPMHAIMHDLLTEGRRMHHVHGILQIDVTDARRRMREIRTAGGEAPSMTAYIVACLARAIDENRLLHAYRKGRKLFLFDEVDVSTVVERVTESGDEIPTSMIIRRANKKTLKEIQSEIRAAQTVRLAGPSLGDSEQARRTNLLVRLPRFIRRILWWKLRRDPKFRKANMGTVHVTAVGMFADGFDTGWAIPIAPWALILTVGTISKRLVRADNGEIGDREFVNLTLTVDHDVVDGSPATRFVARFRQLLESQHGLDSLEA